MKKVKLFVNNNNNCHEVEKLLIEKLKHKNFSITEENYDIAIAIGGDGSFLRMVKETAFNEKIIYVGINAGTLGFAQEIRKEELDEFITNLEQKKYKIEEIGIAEVEITLPDTKSKQLALNEVVVREASLNTTYLKINVENHLLENYVGDGILISTSFGSTAYNLSFGGSMVYNTFHTLQITPIAPLNNKTYRNLLNSLIIPSNKEINIIPEKRTKDLLLTIDGDNNEYKNIQHLTIKTTGRTIKVFRNQNYNFIHKINNKFLK